MNDFVFHWIKPLSIVFGFVHGFCCWWYLRRMEFFGCFLLFYFKPYYKKRRYWFNLAGGKAIYQECNLFQSSHFWLLYYKSLNNLLCEWHSVREKHGVQLNTLPFGRHVKEEKWFSNAFSVAGIWTWAHWICSLEESVVSVSRKLSPLNHTGAACKPHGLGDEIYKKNSKKNV